MTTRTIKVKLPSGEIVEGEAVVQEDAPFTGDTYIGVVLDESGSMAPLQSDTIGGFNTFLAEQKAALPTGKFTLVKFNTQRTVVHDNTPTKDVPLLTPETYTPGGMTALNDAVAAVIYRIAQQLTPADRALVLIQTDGEENSSREYTTEQVKALVEAKQATDQWTFVFLGAGIDAFASGSRYGVPTASTMSYAATGQGTQAAFAANAAAAGRYARRGGRGMAVSASFYDNVPNDPNIQAGNALPKRPRKAAKTT